MKAENIEQRTTERPILFTGAMVRAIMEGRKTQTRRVANFFDNHEAMQFAPRFDSGWWKAAYSGYECKCPYGQRGDRLWVRETFATDGLGLLWWRANGDDQPKAGPWKPSIFMPRWASRLTLEITGIRCERLLAICSNRADALAEGMKPGPDCMAEYAALWNRINGRKAGCKWHESPWVWVIEFRREDP